MVARSLIHAEKVNFDAQLQHARIVAKRHRELYSLPFSIPSGAVNRFSPPSAPVEPTLFSDDSTMTSSLGQSDVFESQSQGDVPGVSLLRIVASTLLQLNNLVARSGEASSPSPDGRDFSSISA